MCGRLANQADPAEQSLRQQREPFLAEYWGEKWARYRSYDVRPSTKVPILMPPENGMSGMQVQAVRWGWSVSWMKRGLINCRWETATELKTFKEAVRKRRCVVPAVAYYEWERDEKDKPLAKFAFFPENGETLLLAGLWTENTGPDGASETRFLVLTREMVRFRTIHHRTPVMLGQAAAECWLDHSAPEADVLDAAACFGDDYLVPREVTFDKAQNKVDGPHLLEPLPPRPR